mmetsp:Transcript_43027/g.98927  ORF Transcript_43027/g.98927 Transcript_43027/m.98927 type:complete len:211 (+) Transcript_43027:959-1591(+)
MSARGAFQLHRRSTELLTNLENHCLPFLYFTRMAQGNHGSCCMSAGKFLILHCKVALTCMQQAADLLSMDQCTGQLSLELQHICGCCTFSCYLRGLRSSQLLSQFLLPQCMKLTQLLRIFSVAMTFQRHLMELLLPTESLSRKAFGKLLLHLGFGDRAPDCGGLVYLALPALCGTGIIATTHRPANCSRHHHRQSSSHIIQGGALTASAR